MKMKQGTPQRSFQPRKPMGAERITQLLGDLAGAVVHPVGDDQNGWDCLLEFPPIGSTDLPADLAPPGLAILLQVKSSERRPNSVRISLSNALKYARHPLPVFLVLVKTDGSLLSPTVYVKHVWDPLISDFLKAVRQAEVDGQELHRKTISVTFNDGDRHDTDAVRHIAQVVDGFGSNYATQKEALVDAVGFEDGYGVGNLSFDGIEPEKLVNLMLGLEKWVDISRFTYSEARFGIKNPTPNIDATQGRVSIEPTPVSECVVILSRAGSASEMEIPGQIFVPGIPGLPEQYWKLRIKTDIIDFSIAPSRSESFESTIDFTVGRSLDELNALTTFWAGASEGDLNIDIWAQGKRLAGAKVNLSENAESLPWAHLQPVIATLQGLATPSRRPRGMTFQLKSLFSQLSELRSFHDILTGESATLTLGARGIDPQFQPSRLVAPFHLELDGYVFIAVMDRPITSAHISSENLRLILGPPTRLYGSILAGSAEEHRSYIADTVTELPQIAEKNVLSYVPQRERD